MKTVLTTLAFAFGLSATQAQQWATYNTASSAIPSNWVTSLCPTDHGSWVGTDQGLSYFGGRDWTVYNEQNSLLPDNFVNAVTYMGHGMHWVGTNNGILCASDNLAEWAVLNTTNSPLPNSAVKCILQAESGTIFIGTWGGGVVQINDGEWTIFNTSNSPLPNNGINDLYIDSYNRLWVSTYNGVAVYNGWQWEVMSTSNSTLPNNDVQFVQQDGEGNYLIGTSNGMLRIDQAGQTTVLTATTVGFSLHATRTAAANKQGNLLVATDAGIITVATNGSISRINSNNSELPNNNLWALALDPADNLYIGMGNNGMAIYNPSGLSLSVDDEQAASPSLSLYPNPVDAGNLLTINLNGKAVTDISIYDLTGREVMNLGAQHLSSSRFTGQVSTAGLQPGTYTCVLRTSFGRETVKFLVL